MTREQTKNFVNRPLDFRPKKRLGQNFLISEKAVSRIIAAADLKKTDFVLEIGPGLGALTKEIASVVKQVIAVEKDPELAKALQGLLESWNIKNVEVVVKDILELQVTSYKLQNYKIIGNLPFYITYPVIRKFTEVRPLQTQPELMVFVVQKEVGERICAKPPRMSKPAIFTQFYASPKIVGKISRTCFFPQPKVDSVILKLAPVDNFQRSHLWKLSTGGSSQKTRDRAFFEKWFSKIVSAGFSHPRKQLVNNLLKELGTLQKKDALNRRAVKNWLKQNNISPSQRAETLRVNDWVNLAKSF